MPQGWEVLIIGTLIALCLIAAVRWLDKKYQPKGDPDAEYFRNKLRDDEDEETKR